MVKPTALLLALLLAACGDSSGTAGLTAAQIPIAHTPPGGYGDAFPATVLSACTEPLVADATDLRGMWKTVAVEVNGGTAPANHPAWRHVERIEQCGDRTVIAGGGVIHDMRCDGTFENGVHDVYQADYRTPLNVICTWESGVHVLQPTDLPGVRVTRSMDGDRLKFVYVSFTSWLERTGPPESPTPSVE